MRIEGLLLRFSVDTPCILIREPPVETPPPPLRVSGRAVVVGGGVAGATAARALRLRGLSVIVIDKGRGPGGRTSTRRSEAGAFDHGAQFFTARSLPFADAVCDWAQAGAVQRWVGRFGELNGDGLRMLPDRNLWVGIPGMSRVVSHQLDGTETRFEARACGLGRSTRGWSVQTESGDALGPFDHAVIAVPAPQAAELLGEVAPAIAERASGVRLAPCWSVMAAFDRSLGLPFEGLRVRSDSALSWMARDSAKPEREPEPLERWVLHAGPEWSEAHVELEREDAGARLIREFLDLVSRFEGAASTPVHLRAHRWRYARTVKPLGTPCLHEPASSLVVCGDWCLGSRVEDAWTSGTAAAEALVGSTAC
ncbi:MAG: NAD(P)/FAD-dependent oxidoreductase [Phycisphaerales bacterium JB054]